MKTNLSIYLSLSLIVLSVKLHSQTNAAKPAVLSTTSPCTIVVGSNLIFNGEFEDFAFSSGAGVCLADCWRIVSSSPDILTSGSSSSICNTNFNPTTFGTWNNLASNKTALGLWGSLNSTGFYDQEATQAQLVSNIIAGRTYRIEMWVQILTGNVLSVFDISGDGNIDIALTNSFLPSTWFYDPNSPLINVLNLPSFTNIPNNNGANPWTKLSATFVAPANYNGLIIANARYRNPINNQTSYIVIDNVSLIDESIICSTTPNYIIPAVTPSNPTSTVTLSSLTSSTSPVTGQVFQVGDGATLIIDYNVTMTGCKFRMGKEANISINSSAATNKQSTYNNCEFYSCGTYMWSGISTSLGNINNFNNCTIEDAQRGISCSRGVTLNLVGNTFNKNYIGVYVSTTNLATGIMPLVFDNNKFLSAGSTNSPTNVLKLVQPIGTTGYINPSRSYRGILSEVFKTAVVLKIGTAASTTSGNLFDNQDIGINLKGTKADLYNNTFSNSAKGVLTSTLVGSNLSYGYGLKVGGPNAKEANKFNNCATGIELSQGYDNVTIESNQFNGIVGGNNLFGINAPIDRVTTLNVNNNTSDYYTNFFQHSIPTLPATSTAGLTLNVNTNTINHATSPIFVAQNGASNTSTFVYNISNNTINTSSNGILTNNMAKCLKIENNNITILNAASGFSEAIALTGGCNDALVKNNTIKSDAATVNNVTNPDLFGIHVFGSANTQILCNSMDKMGSCLAFEGPCLTGSNFINANVLQSGVYGLRLMNNGRIGTQGNSTTKNENSWGASGGSFPGTTRFQTYVQSTAGVNNTATGSVLYLLSGSIPTDNGSLFSGQQYTIGTTVGLRTATNNGTTLSCGSGGGGGSLTAARIIDVGTPIANNTASYPTFTSDNALRAKQQLYQMVEDEPSAKADANINAFYNTAKMACIGKLKQVSDEINAQNYSAAIAINNSISANCNTDASEKQYYQLYLKYITNAANFTNQDRADLVLLANRCPQKRGAVVYKARVFNDFITETKNNYSDNCNSISNAKVVSDFPFDGDDSSENDEKENNSSLTFESIINISPNPNNGSFNIQFEKAIESTIFISIIDIKGLVLLNKKVELKGNSIHVDISNLSNGVYSLKLSDNKGNDRKAKLVIFKNE
jgi:hypothetical protein